MSVRQTDAIRQAVWAPESDWDRGTHLSAILIALRMGKNGITRCHDFAASYILNIGRTTMYERLRRLNDAHWISSARRGKGTKEMREHAWIKQKDPGLHKGANAKQIAQLMQRSDFRHLTDLEKLIAVVIAGSANRETCLSWPSKATIAKHARTDRVTVRKVIKKFRTLELFKVTARSNSSGQTTNGYLLLPEPDDKPGRDPEYDLAMVFVVHARQIGLRTDPPMDLALAIRRGVETKDQSLDLQKMMIEAFFENPEDTVLHAQRHGSAMVALYHLDDRLDRDCRAKMLAGGQERGSDEPAESPALDSLLRP